MEDRESWIFKNVNTWRIERLGVRPTSVRPEWMEVEAWISGMSYNRY
jgi:uncharacterized protein YbcI